MKIIINNGEKKPGRKIFTLHSTDEQSSTSSPSELSTLQNNKIKLRLFEISSNTLHH